MSLTDKDDKFGYEQFKEIGKLSSMLPAYVRQCCRSLHDGTDTEVLEAYRENAIKVLWNFQKKYAFVDKHLSTLKLYDSSTMQELIRENPGDRLKEALYCLCTSSNNGLPKRACLHCPKVGTWIKIMNRAGTINPETGDRYELK